MMKIKETLIIAALVLLAIFSYGQQASVNDFSYNTFYDPNYPNDSLLFRLLEPYQYNPAESIEYPVFVWLHPNGRQGTNNTNQMGDGWVDYLIDSTMRVTFPAFVIAPQCSPGMAWWEDNPRRPTDMTYRLLDSLINNERIDASRIYVMGWSLGGFGTWGMLESPCCPNYLAAAVPIAGAWPVSNENFDPVKYEGAFIWAGHGSNDNTVGVDRTRDRIAAIRDAGYNAIYSEFPVPHGSHDETMAEPDIWTWLFSQDRDGGIVPLSPTNLQVAINGSNATLTWDAPIVNSEIDSIMAYNVYRNGIRINTAIDDLTGSTGTGINDLTRTNSYIDSAYVAGDTYEVRSVNYRNQESSLTTSLDEVSKTQGKIILFPNPAESFIRIEGDFPVNKQYSIITIDGKIVQRGGLINQEIDIQKLNTGVYLLQLDEGKLIRFIKK